jgi:hypothetical protein
VTLIDRPSAPAFVHPPAFLCRLRAATVFAAFATANEDFFVTPGMQIFERPLSAIQSVYARISKI